MTLDELVEEYAGPRAPGWLVLDVAEILPCGIEATRYYAAFGEIASLAQNDPDTGLPLVPAPPTTDVTLINEDTDLTVGEWALVRPLFVLYVERENAQRLEASRAAGLEVYGRSVAEVAADIQREEETLPQRAFSFDVIEVI